MNDFDFKVRDKGKLRDVGDPIDNPVVHHIIFLILSPPRKGDRAFNPKIALLGGNPSFFFKFSFPSFSFL